MTYWTVELDGQLLVNRCELLEDKGYVSHEQTIEKAKKEFYIYRTCELKQLKNKFDHAMNQLEKEKQTNK
jgi:hypothetical protein